jgi:hypothetical protein
MNIIEKEEYLKALDIVLQFHKQINLKTIIDFNTLQFGDIIVFEKSASKYVTVGKEYIVCKVSDWFKNENDWYHFISDDGKEKSLRKYSRGYIVNIKK